MNKIFHLVYVSQAVEDISYTDIQDILHVSRDNNAQVGITGLLIFRDGYFLQLLEGDEVPVKKVVEKIIEDDRNFKLRVLVETRSSERLFDEWAMAFFDGDISANETQPLIDLFALVLDKSSSQRDRIMSVLKTFQSSAPLLK
ncbi:Blue light- and temperature-regulated antirepressor YcgF [compost metagenome]